MNVNETKKGEFDLTKLYCYNKLKNIQWIENSIGSLGGGNHFIEIDVADDGDNYLTIHSGSRNLGAQVADYYQDLADQICNHDLLEYEIKYREIITTYKQLGKTKDIQKDLDKLKKGFEENKNKIPYELAYLENEQRNSYLHDMKICQECKQKN